MIDPSLRRLCNDEVESMYARMEEKNILGEGGGPGISSPRQVEPEEIKHGDRFSRSAFGICSTSSIDVHGCR